MKIFCRLIFLALVLWLAIPGSTAESTNSSRLTLREAEEIAVKNHPRISAADLRALAAQQVTIEARSPFFPNLSANATSVGAADDNTRIAAGVLNNPAIFDRNAEGLILSQLITDFGRTANLTASARLRAHAEQENALATRSQILLQVSATYLSSLQAQALMDVAQQTLRTRQLLLDRVSVLASNKIKSELDVSFARVSLEEGNLLLSKSQNDLRAAFARLNTLLGYRDAREFRLVEEPFPTDLATNASELVAQALRDRPELARFRYERDAAIKFAKAEKRLRYPTISAVGSVGVIPIHDDRLADNYAAAGVNVNLPLFTGGLLSARQSEAEKRAKATEEILRAEEDDVIRDVRIAWLNANNALERVGITKQLLQNATRSFDLAQARYNIGSSSIVELSQAELNQTSARIVQATAQYDYQILYVTLEFQSGKLSSLAQSLGREAGSQINLQR